MAGTRPKRSFRFDRVLLAALMLLALGLAARGWLKDHPQHNPWAPLELADAPGWATAHKLALLRDNVDACRAVLERGEVAFEALSPAGEGECRREDRTALGGSLITPAAPQMTCPVAAGFALWLRHGVAPSAQDLLGSPVVRIEHLGTYNCRRIGGGADGDWSEHATGNALDIAAFVLADGRRISVRDDWAGDDDEARFLRAVRSSACTMFRTVLSPDYNAAHADHFHFDQADRMVGSVCR